MATHQPLEVAVSSMKEVVSDFFLQTGSLLCPAVSPALSGAHEGNPMRLKVMWGPDLREAAGSGNAGVRSKGGPGES